MIKLHYFTDSEHILAKPRCLVHLIYGALICSYCRNHRVNILKFWISRCESNSNSTNSSLHKAGLVSYKQDLSKMKYYIFDFKKYFIPKIYSPGMLGSLFSVDNRIYFLSWLILILSVIPWHSGRDEVKYLPKPIPIP